MNNTKPANPILAQNLTHLAELCSTAGATASTVIYSNDHLVFFYKDPQTVHLRAKDTYDELHIDLKKNSCILIAVFPESPG